MRKEETDMLFLHYLNAVLWLLNALLWGAYAGSLGMAVVSLLAAGLAVGMARMAEPYP